MKKTPKIFTMPLRLSEDERRSLEWAAAQYGNITYAAVIRKALATECYLIEQKNRGASLLIEERDGRLKEIILR
ncbi:hypothetical protein [Sinorhizobium sp. BG8]|uniref:hypothetical protein n=1 Tax=Sinorhizobium sp. BG8 TaxID=2613773 RepID=UPI00193D1C48|nr:hypothetical protein [Sinorhizobium sp. BG8]QRM53802.1 hypothetical protein F3Y30_03945 [Sinorhizobium sp. BG8]